MRIRIAVVTAGLHPIHFPDEYFDVNTKKKKKRERGFYNKRANVNRKMKKKGQH